LKNVEVLKEVKESQEGEKKFEQEEEFLRMSKKS
jgi:hypothetical protein